MNDGFAESAPAGALAAIRILTAQRHYTVRRSVRSLLGAESDLEIVGEATASADVPWLIAQLQPQVAVIDLCTGSELTDIVSAGPRTAIVIFTVDDSRGYVEHALRAGVRGYVRADDAGTELAVAVRVVARGERYVTPRRPSRSPTADQ